MILWIASYPRSGNTLCRLVMHSCFGVGSYSDQGNGFERPLIGVGEERGLLEFEGEWDAFYAKASENLELNLIKTHLHPRDDQPAIVVMRDPRSALCSYHHYLREYSTHQRFTLEQIVRGEVVYGDFIEFYRKWMSRPPGTTLLVRYHELVELDNATLNRLAAFTGLDLRSSMPVDFETLKRSRPAFFRSGKTSWGGDPEWTAEVEAIFQERFAPVMERFGDDRAQVGSRVD